MHYIFVCPKYSEERKVMLDELERRHMLFEVGFKKLLDDVSLMMDWKNADNEEKWRAMIFPLQEAIGRASHLQDKDVLDRLLGFRKEVLSIFLDYIWMTKRWKEEKESWYFDF